VRFFLLTRICRVCVCQYIYICVLRGHCRVCVCQYIYICVLGGHCRVCVCQCIYICVLRGHWAWALAVTGNVIERNPPQRWVSLLGSFQIKNREEVDPKWRTTPKIDQFWGWFLAGGPLPPSSFFGNHPTNIPPRGGGFFRSNMWVSIQLPKNSMDACVPRFFHPRPSRPSNASSIWVAICEFRMNWLEFVEFCVF